jgi:hypothetical protein
MSKNEHRQPATGRNRRRVELGVRPNVFERVKGRFGCAEDARERSHLGQSLAQVWRSLAAARGRGVPGQYFDVPWFAHGR